MGRCAICIFMYCYTYCAFLTINTRNLRQKLNTKLKSKLKNTKLSFDNYKETRNLKQKLKTLSLA